MTLRFVPLLLPFIFLVGCETTEPEKKYYLSSYRGMETKTRALGNTALVKESDPNTMKRYTRVIVEDVKVIPSKNKDPKIKAATREESERLAERFEVILKEELGRHYEVTSYRSYNTIAVRAALTELRPSNPALFAVNYMPYAGAAATGIQLATGETLGAGSTSVEAEVVDSRSRRQLYAMVDQLKGGKLQPGSLEKWGQSEGAMRMWSRQIRKGIQGQTVESKVAVSTTTRKPAEKPTTKTVSKTVSKPTSKTASTKKPAPTKTKVASTKTSTKKPAPTKPASKTGEEKKPFWVKKAA